MFKKIIIVGGGIAGLTLANFLKKSNFNNFRIYERFERKSSRPTGIQLTPNAVRILDFLDTKFFLNNNFHRINYLSINPVHSGDFTSKFEVRMNLQNIVSDKIPYLTCDRNILIKFLEKNLTPKEIFYNKQVVQTIKDHNIIRVKFSDGSEDYCDLLVSADGMFSKSRLDNNIIKNYIGESPKTQELGDASPGNIGSYAGWQIVKKYMSKNPSTTLQQLMQLDNDTLFTETKYKP